MSIKMEFESDEQRKVFLETITSDNCGEKLTIIREALSMTRRDFAKCIGCSEATISRIESKKTKATNDFLNRMLGLVFIGHAKYKSLTEDEKKKLAEYVAAGGAALSGVGGAIGLISTSGAVAGLSAAGVTSGLAAIGGSMVTGVALVASIPVVAGLASFGVVKGLKAICEANRLNCKEVDGRFEIIRRSDDKAV